MQAFVQGAWGVIPAHLSELSPDQVRGFLPGFAYQCGVLIASSVAYLEAVLATRMSYARSMAIVAVIVFSAAAIIAWLGRERHAIDVRLSCIFLLIAFLLSCRPGRFDIRPTK